jgi:hypothetical protein
VGAQGIRMVAKAVVTKKLPDSPMRYYFIQNGNEIEVQDNYDWNTCFIKTDRRL